MGRNHLALEWMDGLALACALSTYAVAQDDLRWIARYDGPAHYTDVPRCTAVDAEGFVYVAGESTGTRPTRIGALEQLDWVILKYSPEGSLVWERRHGEGRVFDERAVAMVIDEGGNVFVTGSAAQPGALRADIATLKYDASGLLLWARYTDEGSHYSGGGTGIVLDGEGGVVVTGHSHFGLGANQSRDIATIRYDRDGNILWQRAFASASGGPDRSYALARDAEGNYTVTGQAAAAPGWLGEESHELVTIQYDSQGRLRWVQRYNGLQSGQDTGLAIQAGSSGNIYVTGRTQSGIQTWYGDDSITLAYSKQGELLWTSRFDGLGKSLDQTYHMAVDDEENIFIGGLSMSSAGYPDTDMVVIKLDRVGRRHWVKTFPNPHGYASSGQVSGLALSPDGELLVAGTYGSGGWGALRLSPADGSVTWESHLGASFLGLFAITGAMALTSEGDLVISGMASAGGGFDFLTLKLYPE